MRYDILQGDIIKKLYAVDKNITYFIDTNDEVWTIDKFTCFKIPPFFCYTAFPIGTEISFNPARLAWKQTDPTILEAFRMEIINGKKAQIFHNAETGEEIKLNTALYSKYFTRADQLSFWGSDRKSPVFLINGDAPDFDNVVAMVLPFV